MLTFSERINAPRPVVWNVLTEDALFRKWTSAFCEGSHFVGDWTENSEMRFLDPGGEGMISAVAVNEPHARLHVKHIGTVSDGKENRDIKDAWGEGRENYDLAEDGEGTVLRVEMDAPEEHFYFFRASWPKALDEIKKLSESEVLRDVARETQNNSPQNNNLHAGDDAGVTACGDFS